MMCAFVVLPLATGCAPDATGGEPDPLKIEAILEATTPFQYEIIEDGVVTAAEFERALLARRECTAEVGATPGEIYSGRNGELTFDYDIVADSDDELLAIQADADACLRDYFVDVGSVWAYQRILSPEERERLRPKALACLDSAGLTELAEDASVAEMAEAIQRDGEISRAERECLVEFNSLFATYADDPHGGHTDE